MTNRSIHSINQSHCRFVTDVNMWVFEEMVEGRKLTEIINTEHENVKYLPGRPLPPNIVAVPDISDAALDADILIFVLPHQFISRACSPLKGKLKPGATGLSLIKVKDREKALTVKENTFINVRDSKYCLEEGWT